jgi:hypothetical protein
VESADVAARFGALDGTACGCGCVSACMACCCGGGCSDGGWALGGREGGAHETCGLAAGLVRKAGELPKKVAMAARHGTMGETVVRG